ncbi:MAG: zeta toxin family protein [Alphaproteobacteria bacterium]|nr:zeta toxin family protein [Alphaproteobacteria bacterium]MCW5740841.1 zeta toxin family protein [Alphaproteobacteria bacterium]
MSAPVLTLLAGPNGAGKSTYARENLQELAAAGAFLNADDMARDLDADDVQAVAMRAGRQMLSTREVLLSEGRSFCVETTMATRTLLNFAGRARSRGYSLRLIFLFTAHSSLNESRVKQRVMLGGHNIDTDTIRRRHRRGLMHLPEYWAEADDAIVLDVRTRIPTAIVQKIDGTVEIRDSSRFAVLNARIVASGGKALRG